MTDTQRGLLQLMKSAVTGTACPLPQGFELKDAIAAAQRHQILSLIYEGALLCGYSAEDETMLSVFSQHVRSVLKCEGQQKEVARVEEAFRQHGIDYLPLKGCNMRPLYPKPELRAMGDADILIRTEQYPQISEILPELGFTMIAETDHELVWGSKKLVLELHKHLMPSANRDYHSYFGNGWHLARQQDGCRYAMSREDEFLFLFTHFAKHYRDGGVGCRYVLDLWLYRRTYRQLDEAYIRRELTLLRLDVFYGHICNMIRWWFEDGQADAVTEYISDFILSGSTWGDVASHRLSQELRASVALGSVRKERIRRWFFLAFPPADFLSRRYPILKKHPWLTPFLWPVRWVTAVLFRRKMFSYICNDYKNTSSEQIEQRRQALEFVGLDYVMD